MKITIAPQDKSTPEARSLTLHPQIWKRLDEYAAALNDSDASYVAGAIFDQALPPLKTAKEGGKTKAKEPTKITQKTAVA